MPRSTPRAGILDLLLHQDGEGDPEIRAASLATLNDNDLLSVAALFWTQIGWFWAIAASGWLWILCFSLLDLALFVTRWCMRRRAGPVGRAMERSPEALFTSVNVALMALVSIDVLVLTQVPSDRASTLGIILAVGFSGYASALFTAFPVLATFNIVMLFTSLELGLAFGASDHGRPFALLAPCAGIAFWLLTHQTHMTLMNALHGQRDSRLLAMQDPLTRLANRSAMWEGLTSAVTAIGQPGGLKRVAVLSLDLDGFKAINDRHGHAAGDRVLLHVADTLRRACAPGDIPCRIGGDEYILLLPNAGEARIRIVAAALIEAVSRPLDVGGAVPVHVGVSIGATVVTERGRGVDDILEAADTALYRAKRAGRGQLVLDDRRVAAGAGSA